MRNPGSIGYLVIQLFSSQLLGLCPYYDTTPTILLCGAVVFSYVVLAFHPGSAPGVLNCGTGNARYPSKIYALHWQAVTQMITLFDMWENGCGMGHSQVLH